jgi:hypothetical protein
MNYLSKLLLTILIAGLASAAFAQDASQKLPTLAVTAAAGTEKVRFTAPASVVQMRVEVFSASGSSVAEVAGKGNVLDWTMSGPSGDRLAAGDYACVVTIKSLSGRMSQRVGVLSFSEGHVSVLASAKITDAQNAVIGPIESDSALTAITASDIPAATIVSHTGTDGAVTSTTGALTFRTGDVLSGAETERMRITPDGRIGIGTKDPRAAFEVAGNIKAERGFTFADGSTLSVDANGKMTRTRANGTTAPDAAGTGTINRIAKWVETGGAGTLGDTLLFENNGLMGVNTSTPGTLNGVSFSTVPFHVFRPGNSVYAAIEAAGLSSFAGLILNRDTAAANSRMWVIDNQPTAGGGDSLLGFSTYTDAGQPTPRMSITRTGLVSIPGSLHAPTMSYSVIAGGTNSGNAGAVPGNATVLEIGDNVTADAAATVVLPASAANGTILTFGTSDPDGAVVFGVTAVAGGSYSFNINQSARFVRVGGVWKFMGQ